MKLAWVLVAVWGVVAVGCQGTERVSDSTGRAITPTAQIVEPVGQVLRLTTRPVDFAFSGDGKTVAVKDNNGIAIIDAQKFEPKQYLKSPSGTSLRGIIAGPDDTFWMSDAGSAIHQAKFENDTWKWIKKVDLPSPYMKGASFPCGLKLLGQSRAVVALSRGNGIAIVNLSEGKIERVLAADLAPFDVAVSADGNFAYVSCWGGPSPKKQAKTQKSAGTEIEVNKFGIVKTATVQKIELATGKPLARAFVGLQPSQLLLDKSNQRLFVANANADFVDILDGKSLKRIARVDVRPDAKFPFGTAPNSLALSSDESMLWVACGGINAIAAVQLSGKPKVVGFVPTGWYPGAVQMQNDTLWVANIKGMGSRNPDAKGNFHVTRYSGTIQRFDVPQNAEFERLSAAVKLQCGLIPALRAQEFRKTDGKGVLKPIPVQRGQISPIEHVVYIIKENRTYDQVFGDLPQGDGRADLCTFGRNVSPNHHALAEQFVLLDNYYCNGVISADGHAWVMEGNASSYLERSFGGWTRSYPFGDDPISVSASGFLWDWVRGNGLSVLNFGEFQTTSLDPDRPWKELYADYVAGKPLGLKHVNETEHTHAYSIADMPGWEMKVPDQLRADIFLRELRGMNTFPNLVTLYLPNDHGSGTSPGMPTPRAHMADNDLALGRVIEALSRTEFWKKMAIFVIEDDPQDGWDHVDGHRSICLVVSPYAKRGAVISNFYNQTSVLHTMLRILGVKPKNALTAMAPLMDACFTDQPDFRPFQALKNNIPLDEVNPPRATLTGPAAKFADLSMALDYSKPDAGGDDIRNRITWFATMGNRPYPVAFAGAHGKGLKKKRLKLEGGARETEDD